MSIIAWIILGLLAGGLAKFIMPGKDPGGCIVTMLIGIVGAVVGGWVSTLLGFGGLSGSLDWRNLLIAILGSLILLFIWRLISSRK